MRWRGPWALPPPAARYGWTPETGESIVCCFTGSFWRKKHEYAGKFGNRKIIKRKILDFICLLCYSSGTETVRSKGTPYGPLLGRDRSNSGACSNLGLSTRLFSIKRSGIMKKNVLCMILAAALLCAVLLPGCGGKRAQTEAPTDGPVTLWIYLKFYLSYSVCHSCMQPCHLHIYVPFPPLTSHTAMPYSHWH